MIKDNLHKIKNSISKEITLVAVSKTKPIIDLQNAYNAGQRVLEKIKYKRWLINLMLYQKILNGI